MTVTLIIYYLLAFGILCFQFLVLLEAGRHFNYLRRKWPPKPSPYQPRTVLIAPCKGLETTFERNITALFQQDYHDYSIRFVMDSPDDAACQPIQALIERQRQAGNPVRAEIVFASPTAHNSRKVNNLLTVCLALSEEEEVFAFVDSDACPAPHFLGSLVHPLRREEVGASTGYRWYVPADNRLSSQVLSAMNAFFASMLGPHGRNPVWGGAMAFKRSFFYEAGIDQLWQGALSDDYAVSHAVRQENKEVYFVPACFVASIETVSWREMFEFIRRQFIITWCCARRLWVLAATGFGQYLMAFWGGLAVTLGLWAGGNAQWKWALVLPVALYVSSFLKALLRQIMIMRILRDQRSRLMLPAVIDLFLQPALASWTLVCILSAWGRNQIVWRGVRYKIHSIDRTEVLS